MAGTISLSLSQQFDAQGAPLSGGKLYFFQSGTTTPQNAYQDFPLTTPHPNPIILDASGRVPAFYLADGFIKIRLADENGVTVIAADGLLVVGPSTGGGGGGTVDPTSVLTTGDVKARYARSIDTLSGFVRCNGRSIGSATSGATERANADAQLLFEYLWAADPNLAVSSGRGATGNADWLANKQLSLPDMRGRTLAGLDDMGASAAGRLTASFFGVAATTLGNAGGDEKNTLAAGQLPAHNHPLLNAPASGGSPGGLLTMTVEDADHTHAIPQMDTGGASARHRHSVTAINSAANIAISGTNTVGSALASTFDSDVDTPDHTHRIPANTYITEGISATHRHVIGGTTQDSTGGGGAHANAQPTMVLVFYMKL